jgi:glycosyltransferase involved in cell wall biosynthesis
VFLIDSLGIGGAEYLTALYLQHLDTIHFKPRVCTLNSREGNPVAERIQRLGIPVDLLSIRKLRNPYALPRLLRYLRAHRADLIHTQLGHSNVLGNIAAWVLGIPAVSTQHLLGVPPRGRREYWWHQAERWALRYFCDRIVAVSEGVRQDRRLVGIPPDKVITIYNGIDLSRFVPSGKHNHLAVRQSLKLPPDVPLLITVAILRPQKGIQYLIEALPMILGTIRDLRYVIVGRGGHETTLKDLAKAHGVAERVIFTGMREDIPDLLAMSDLFVLPTLDDALPTVLMEAMATQKPIVASHVGGVPEMIEHGHNGLLVPPGNPGKLAAACIRLIQNPEEARRMGRAGRQIVEQRFDIHRQVQCFSRLYQTLLAERGR